MSPFVILDLAAGVATLQQRIAQRVAAGSDASDADLGGAPGGSCVATSRSLGAEQPSVIGYDAEARCPQANQPDAWRALRERLDPARPSNP